MLEQQMFQKLIQHIIWPKDQYDDSISKRDIKLMDLFKPKGLFYFAQLLLTLFS